jgi:hypothetical protein
MASYYFARFGLLVIYRFLLAARAVAVKYDSATFSILPCLIISLLLHTSSDLSK